MTKRATGNLTATATLIAVLCATTAALASSPNSPRPSVRPQQIMRPAIRLPHIHVPSISNHVAAGLGAQDTQTRGQQGPTFRWWYDYSGGK